MTSTASTASTATAATPELAAFDLYRDVHKAIRAELFRVTVLAGTTDPADRAAREALRAAVVEVVDVLTHHAAHEDRAIQPSIERHLPSLAARILVDHEALDTRMAHLVSLAEIAVEALEPERRIAVHRLYAELATFTSAYLAHQDYEDRVIMPALEAAVGLDATMAIHVDIVTSIAPDVMARFLAIMIPAMNLDDRSELLGGMRAVAPPEVFEGLWGLTTTILSPADLAPLAARLAIASQ